MYIPVCTAAGTMRLYEPVSEVLVPSGARFKTALMRGYTASENFGGCVFLYTGKTTVEAHSRRWSEDLLG